LKREIFRKEALAAKQDKLIGAALFIRPITFSFLTVFFLCVCFVVFIFMFKGEYTRKEHVIGYLVPDQGLIKVHTPQAGVILECFIKEGQFVEKGARLFSISFEKHFEKGASESTAIELLRARRNNLMRELDNQNSINTISKNDLQEKNNSISLELTELKESLATQQQRVAGAKKNVARYQKLVAANFVSENQLLQQQDLLLEQIGILKDIVRKEISLSREYDANKKLMLASRFKDQNQQSLTSRDILEIEQQIADHEVRKLITVVAPKDGKVTTLTAKIGQAVNIENPLVTIIPRSAKLEAHLFVPTRASGFIKLNQSVSLRYEAFPYQRFGNYSGRVVEINRSVLLRTDESVPRLLSEAVYRVVVKLDSQDVIAYGVPVPLQSEMQLEADIEIDRRKFIDWLLDPIYSITGKF
jgi:membrane fusion protein